MVLTAPTITAQTPQDTSHGRERHQRRLSREFVDENGDGIDDRLLRAAAGSQRGKDRFVDEDGDGICDNRANGLGFRYGAGRGAGLTKGADGLAKGRRGGSGGKP
jgi:hypothetical protein